MADANLLFVQSPSACINRSSTVCFLHTNKIRSSFFPSLELARVNNSAAFTDTKLSVDVFDWLSSTLVIMSVVQSLINFFSESSLSFRSPSVWDRSNPYKSSSPESPTLKASFLPSIESLIYRHLGSLNWRNPDRSVIFRVWSLCYIWMIRFIPSCPRELEYSFCIL